MSLSPCVHMSGILKPITESTKWTEQSFFVPETKVGHTVGRQGYVRTLTNGADTTFTIPCTYIVLRTSQTAKPTQVNHMCLATPRQKAKSPNLKWFCSDLNARACVQCFHVHSLILQCILSVLNVLTLAATCTYLSDKQRLFRLFCSTPGFSPTHMSAPYITLLGRNTDD